MWLEEGGAHQSEVFEVLLAVTEAFANAVKHPREPRSWLVDVDGVISDHSVTVSIRDYGTWADELRRTCASFQARGRRLSLDLSGVTFADTAGVALLRELARGEATIADCTPFLALQMEE